MLSSPLGALAFCRQCDNASCSFPSGYFSLLSLFSFARAWQFRFHISRMKHGAFSSPVFTLPAVGRWPTGFHAHCQIGGTDCHYFKLGWLLKLLCPPWTIWPHFSDVTMLTTVSQTLLNLLFPRKGMASWISRAKGKAWQRIIGIWKWKPRIPYGW